MFLSAGESTSGFSNLFSAQLPLAMIFLAGVLLLALDIVGVKSGKKLGNKFIFSAIISLLPFILIFIFIMMLPSFLPWASALVPGQQVPPQVETMVRKVAGNPVYGADSQVLPVVGTTTVSWGFGIGAYLFLVAAIIRIVAGFMMRTTPELQQQTALPSAQPMPPPPPS
jgi:amino acid transporter